MDTRLVASAAVLRRRTLNPSGLRFASPSEECVANNFLTVVTLGLDPRAHTVMLLHSQFSAFASITGWIHGSALRLSEDDKGRVLILPSLPSGRKRSGQSYRRHPRARPEGPSRDVTSIIALSVDLDLGMVPRISAALVRG